MCRCDGVHHTQRSAKTTFVEVVVSDLLLLYLGYGGSKSTERESPKNMGSLFLCWLQRESPRNVDSVFLCWLNRR